MKTLTLTQKMEAKGYLSVSRVAEMVGMSVHTVYRWIKADEVRGEKVLGHWYVTRASVIAKLGPDQAKLLGLSNGGSHAVAGT